MRQGRHKDRVGLLQRKTIGDSAGYHSRWEWLLDVDPPQSRPHLNGVSLGVEVEGPRGVAIAAVRGGGGGVTAGTTTSVAAMGSAVVVPPSSALQLSRVVIVGHRRRWRNTPGGGAAHQGGGAANGGWGGRPLGFGSSRSKKGT
jgi:hypothetical protein